jgi:hypothetical protein
VDIVNSETFRFCDKRTSASRPRRHEIGTQMKEPIETIRSNIKHYENLLKVDSSAYTHEDVRKLLTAAKVKLRHTEIEELGTKR